MVNMAVTGVSHACLLVELGPICISMTAFLWFKSCEDHSLLKSYNGGLWKKHLQVSVQKKKVRPVLLDTRLGRYVCGLLYVFDNLFI